MTQLPQPNQTDTPFNWNLIYSQIVLMLETQNELNKVNNPEWDLEEHDWKIALITETAELIEETPWKWWKSYGDGVNTSSLKMEIVDIWHFLMSWIMDDRGPRSVIISTQSISESVLERGKLFYKMVSLFPESSCNSLPREFFDQISLTEHSSRFLKAVLTDNYSKALTEFASMAVSAGMSFQDLVEGYLGKALLNRFRWKVGYTPDYIKDWSIPEVFSGSDSEFLSGLIQEVDFSSPNASSYILSRLEIHYQLVKDYKATIHG